MRKIIVLHPILIILTCFVATVLVYWTTGITQVQFNRTSNYYNNNSIPVTVAFCVFLAVLFVLYISLLIKDAEARFECSKLIVGIKEVIIYTVVSIGVMLLGILMFYSTLRYPNLEAINNRSIEACLHYSLTDLSWNIAVYNALFYVIWIGEIVWNIKSYLVIKAKPAPNS